MIGKDAQPGAPWLAPYAALIAEVGAPDAGGPWLARLDALAVAAGLRCGSGLPLRFVDQRDVQAAAYEQHIFETGQVPTRTQGDGGWHDWFNALVWLTLPRTKARLNALQAAAIAAAGIGPRRGGTRDAATLFDENAALFVTTADAPVRALRGFHWHDLFVTGRDAFRDEVRVLLFGHALMQKLRAPYKAVCAHAWVVPMAAPVAGTLASGSPAMQALDVATEASLARATTAAPLDPLRFAPLPVLGIPGWWGPNEDPAFYNDPAVFRAGRTTRAGNASPPSPLEETRE